MTKIILLAIFIIQGVIVFSQKKAFEYTFQKTDESITIDGVLEESVWTKVQVAKDFFQKFPEDSISALSKTEVMLTYDDSFVYLAAICYIKEGERLQATTLYRDFSVFSNDAFIFLIDPYNDGLNGFAFELTPFGSQGERLISNGGTDDGDSDYNWDNKWYSSVKQSEDKWVLEMAIPFKTLRYESNLKKWKVNFIRRNRWANTFSSWYPIPVNLSIINLDFTGDLTWDEPIAGNNFNYSIIPSLTYNASKDYDQNTPLEHDVIPSLDFKLNFGSSLNLDGTINPDFSQIEVDRQQLNIGRFELFFPERRQFFLENSDLFANFGNGNIRPFFSRRIGLAQNEQGLFESTPILGGLRLSGKTGKSSRIGIMNVQTDESLLPQSDSAFLAKATNYSVATYQQQVLKRSSISALFINTQKLEGGLDFENGRFDRLGGAQFEWVSNNNLWNGNAFYFHQFTEENSAPSYGFSLGRTTRHFGAFTAFTHVSEGFQPETGFVPRTNVNYLSIAPFYIFRPDNPKINNIDVFIDTNHTLSNEFSFLDSRIFSGMFIGFSNTSSFLFALNSNYTKLLNPFDPSFSGAMPLAEDSDYFYTSARIRYRTDQRRLFSFSFQNEYGSFFNGNIFTTVNTLNIRWQPYLQFSLDFQYNSINLGEGFGSNEILLVRPQARISFRNNLFLTYITQYNSLQENIGTNIRLQWRFRPVSDLFLVYTDNYTEDFEVRGRGFSFKFIYWI